MDYLRTFACLHDWSYGFSDDIKMWRRGHEQRQTLRSEIKRLLVEGRKAEDIKALLSQCEPNWERYMKWDF